MAYEDIASLANLQSGQSQFAGLEGAKLADPFMNQRSAYQNQLKTLMENPGAFASSPTYKFAFDQGLDALNRRAAATGKTGSGNYLSDLMKYGQQMAGQQFFPQANLLAMLAGATTGSPAAAGLSYTGGINRSQDQQSIGAVARALRSNQTQNQLQPQNWMQQMNQGGSSGTGLPSGGYSIPASYSPYTGPGYMPSADAGTGYMTSDYGATVFGNGGSAYSPTDIYAGGGDMGGYDYGGYDYGGYDTGGYQDYGADYYSGGEEY